MSSSPQLRIYNYFYEVILTNGYVNLTSVPKLVYTSVLISIKLITTASIYHFSAIF